MSIDTVVASNLDAFKGNGRGERYPFVQFTSQGFFIPNDEIEFLAQKMGKETGRVKQALLDAGWNPAQLELGSNTVNGLLAEAIEVIPLRYRTIWRFGDQIISKYRKGARSKRQLAAFIRVSESRFVGPVMITTSGKAASELYQALQSHRETVKELPEVKRALAKGASLDKVAATYTLLFVKGKRTRTKYGSMRTALAWEVSPHYVGDKFANIIANKYYPQAEEWSARKAQTNEAQAPEPEPEPEPQAPPVPPEPEPVPDDDFPF